MASKHFGKVIDFATLGSIVPRAAKAEFNNLRATYAALQNQLSSLPPQPEPINWNFYKTAIRINTYVDDIKTSFEGKKFAYPEDKLSAVIDEEQRTSAKEVVQLRADTDVKIATQESELSKILSEKPLDQVTVDEYLSARPELRKQLHDELAQGNYN